MNDELWMNNTTGECVPATRAIREYYRNHGPLDSWTDDYTPTGEYSESTIEAPDFTRSIRA